MIQTGDGRIGAGEERIGNGIYDKDGNALNAKDSNGNIINDKPIQAVGVSLVDSNGNKVDRWISEIDDFMEVTITTDEQGRFEIEGFIPGDYKLEFEWGAGEAYGRKDVRDYKGTICVNSNLINSSTGEMVEEVSDLTLFENNPPRYSEATDDYIRRLAIDKAALEIDDESLYSDLTEAERKKIKDYIAAKIKTMISSTPKFTAGVEKDGGNSGSTKEEITKMIIPGSDSTAEAAWLGVGKDVREKFEYLINSIDFGIIERPRNSMGVKKHITSIKITSAEGRPVVIAKIGVDGKINAIAGESYISGGYDLDYLWAQIDKGIEQSMTVEIEYEIEVSCKSEIDYANKEYYMFGTNRDEGEVLLKAEGLYDYTSGATLMSDQGMWENVNLRNSDSSSISQYLQSRNDSSSMIATSTEEEYLKMTNNGKNPLSLDEIKQYFDDNFDGYSAEEKATMVKIFDKWQNENPTTLKALRDLKLDGTEIIQGTADNYLTNYLYKSGESQSARIKVSKQLSVGEDVDINNDVEIAKASLVKTIRTARRVDMSASPLYDRAEYVTVSPATGEDKDYVGWTIVAIGILTVLGSGVILIKRIIK